MRTILSIFLVLIFTLAVTAYAQEIEKDVIATSGGDLEIHFLGHATLMFKFNGVVMHLDPWSRVADYSTLPKADIALLTHDHSDHLDPKALAQVLRDDTSLIYTQVCAEMFPGGSVIKQGMSWKVEGIGIEAVAAYTIKIPEKGQSHPEGECNGYILTFGDKRIYIASETANIPELKDIKDIDIAFLAMDSVYNLSPEEAVDVVKVFAPKVIYPFHYNRADLSPFISAFENDPGIEVRIRDMRIR
jgi:L-ascorbate metabolism protein UlaG (beta-lactamase superfamily)